MPIEEEESWDRTRVGGSPYAPTVVEMFSQPVDRPEKPVVPSSSPPAILWVDVETTGLDPKSDQLLEICFIVTDAYLRFDEEFDVFKATFKPEKVDFAHVSTEVKVMHAESGLWEDSIMSVKSVSSTFNPIASWLRSRGIGENTDVSNPNPRLLGKLPLGGSSVHFDRGFIDKNFHHLLAQYATHRNVDVSSIRSLVKMWWPGKEYAKVERHRAYEDVVDAIYELRYYRTLFEKGLDNA